ncbi:Lid2 complex component snt2 [Neolecta irregularis DAH-3]|uniref:Lid2 complex component snt2 n=1 Tax=Neolecta irregularis (strain DAH-3) TaxID=1198029 RepID=A0A1U7LH06_NEOID|nr:Lid2 complex component snt2 [Neolecta irregularis DAH-3]|eukprot:OLL21929.1 Lid2 complex component snt2 [Neolecta irregularis DAH-3]
MREVPTPESASSARDSSRRQSSRRQSVISEESSAEPILDYHVQATATSRRRSKADLLQKPKKSKGPIVKDSRDGISVELPDGRVLRPDDCVYLICEPPQEPYYLARIMEFTRSDNSIPKIDSIRVNWFYRPRDIHRSHSDNRYLFSTMHSDVCPLSSVRGKCQIKHRSEIADLEEYKKSEDCFYYERMFDRYIQRHYEVVPTKDIRNVPENVGTVLRDRWKFVAVEQGKGKDLCMQQRGCTKCGSWCANAESVRCAVCQNDFHMLCITPPLLKKPTKGFAWTCAPCAREKDKILEANSLPDFRFNKPMSKSESSVAPEEDNDTEQAPTRRETPTHDVSEPTKEQKYANSLWPIRYLGIHCKIEDALDYDDRIYPRAQSRIGWRHQANVVEWFGQPVKYVDRKKNVRKKKGSIVNHLMKEDSMEIDEKPLGRWVQETPVGYRAPRGEDLTSTLLYRPGPMDTREMDEFILSTKPIADKLKVQLYTTNYLDAVVNVLHLTNFEKAKATEELQRFTRKHLKEPTFTGPERERFAEGVKKHGSELHPISSELKYQSSGQCVRFWYQWKKTPIGREIWGSYEGRRSKKVDTTKSTADLGDSSDDSAYDNNKLVRRKVSCKFCSTTRSEIWKKAPGPSTNESIPALCTSCATLWRKYADTYEPKVDKIKKRKAEEEISEDGTIVKKKSKNGRKKSLAEKDDKKEAEDLEEPPKLCNICAVSEPLSFMATCETCKMSVHEGMCEDSDFSQYLGCYGIQNSFNRWKCDVCVNEKAPEVSLIYDCVLCSQISEERQPPHPLKRTIGNNWAHITCAVWIPEIRFGDVTLLEPIEGIGSLPTARWKSICSICKIETGACTNCHSCHIPFHTTCAIQAGYTVGFDIQPIKTSRKDQVITVSFGGESGHMSPAIWCRNHDLKKTTVHPMNEVDESELTALMTYVRNYKQADLTLTGTMRKAQIVVAATKPIAGKLPSRRRSAALEQEIAIQPVKQEDDGCTECDVLVSPMWWRSERNGKMCHMCFWKRRVALMNGHAMV